MAKIVNTYDKWIVTSTGIRERRIVSDYETVASMWCIMPAEQAMNRAEIDVDKIGMLVVATTSSSHVVPSSACQI